MKTHEKTRQSDFQRGITAAREQVATWMVRNSYATGHGDNIEDLLIELEGQAKERART